MTCSQDQVISSFSALLVSLNFMRERMPSGSIDMFKLQKYCDNSINSIAVCPEVYVKLLLLFDERSLF